MRISRSVKQSVSMYIDSGKSATIISSIKRTDGLKLLPMPFVPILENYSPAEFSADDYPGLVESGKPIKTAAVSAVLIAFNWKKNSDRYRRVSKFVEAFLAKFDQFQKPPRHPKWREVSVSSTLAGWDRFEPMQVLLASRTSSETASVSKIEKLIQSIRSEEDRKELFRLFETWMKSRQPGGVSN